jgi:hypothetical protein
VSSDPAAAVTVLALHDLRRAVHGTPVADQPVVLRRGSKPTSLLDLLAIWSHEVQAGTEYPATVHQLLLVFLDQCPQADAIRGPVTDAARRIRRAVFLTLPPPPRRPGRRT